MIAERGDGLLERIVLHSRRRVERLKVQRPIDELRRAPLYGRVPRGFARALGRPEPSVVGEIRFATPPGGLLDAARQPSPAEAARRARAFAASGVSGLSVVVERHFFAGDPSHLSAARAELPEMPILMRDAVVDDYQLEVARAEGADAVTLWAVLGEEAFRALAQRARALSLEVVAEVVGQVQKDLALGAGATLLLEGGELRSSGGVCARVSLEEPR